MIRPYTFPVCSMLFPASAAGRGELGSEHRDHSTPPWNHATDDRAWRIPAASFDDAGPDLEDALDGEME
jgi:hypothetical protein